MGGLLSSEEYANDYVLDSFSAFNTLSYPLNRKLDKYALACICGGEEDGLKTIGASLALTSGGGKYCILPYNIAKTFIKYLDRFQIALSTNNRIKFNLRDSSSSALVSIKPFFGKWYVQLCDLRGRTICISKEELFRLKMLSCLLLTHMSHLQDKESSNRQIISNIVEGKLNINSPNKQLESEIVAFTAIQKEESVLTRP